MKGDEYLSHQPKSCQCSVEGLYQHNVSCHLELVRKAWVFMIPKRGIAIKNLRWSWNLCSESVTCKSLWISLYNIMPSYGTIVSWRVFFAEAYGKVPCPAKGSGKAHFPLNWQRLRSSCVIQKTQISFPALPQMPCLILGKSVSWSWALAADL